MTGELSELVMIAEAVVEVTLMSVEKDSQYPSEENLSTGYLM